MNTNLATVIPFYKKKNNGLRVANFDKANVKDFIKKPPVSTKMECLRSRDEILSVYKILLQRVKSAQTENKEKNAMRNLTMYLCAINIGLRGGDFCKLKWKDVYDDNWNIRKQQQFVPEKTTYRDNEGHVIKRKYITLRYDGDFRFAISNWKRWLDSHNMSPSLNDFLFPSNKQGAISEKSWYDIVEEVRIEAGIKRKIGTHGLRKTYGHSYYKASSDKEKALIQLMLIFGHSDMRITLRYICISDEEIMEAQERMCIFSNESNFSEDVEIITGNGD